MEKIDLKSLNPEEITDFISELGWETYRARQLMSWLYQKRVSDFDSMTDLPLKLRKELKRNAIISSLIPHKVLLGEDGTRKYLFSLKNEGLIESVLIPEKDHLTLCLSTQLGCALKCRFCYTGKAGFIRNLTTAEIINQIEAVLNQLKDKERLRNIVFMGMGEPLANYENTLKALEIIFHPLGFNFSHRRVTLSSAGLVPELRRLGKDNPVNLAISLNAADDETRSFLMPINRKYPLAELLKVCKEYPLHHRKRITFEYVLIKGVNESLKDARKLVDLLRRIKCKINLIPFNEHPGVNFKRPEKYRIDEFRDFLLSNGYTAIVRESRGSDIMAACGQLGGNIQLLSDN